MSSLAFLGVSHIHTPAFLNQVLERGIKVAGVWDIHLEKAEKAAEKLGCAAFCDVDQLLSEEDLGGIIVTSETVLHSRLVPHIVRTRKPVFIEKPLGMGMADAEEMGELLENACIPFQTGYFMRGFSNYRTIKKWVEEGKFGKITRMRFSNCHSGALGGWFDEEWRWMADLSQAGVGAFGDLGTHGLDILMWLGGDVKEAVGFRSYGTARYPNCDELGEALLVFENGIIATLAASWDDWADPVKFQITGTEGAAWIIDNKLYAKFGEEVGEVPAEKLEPEVPAGFAAFLDFMEGKQAEMVEVKDAVSRCVVMDRIYRYSEPIS